MQYATMTNMRLIELFDTATMGLFTKYPIVFIFVFLLFAGMIFTFLLINKTSELKEPKRVSYFRDKKGDLNTLYCTFKGQGINILANSQTTNAFSIIVNHGSRKMTDEGFRSTKKSRTIFADLIVAINTTAQEKNTMSVDQQKILKLQKEAANLQKNFEDALGREISLLYENYELKKQLSVLNGMKIIPIRSSD